MAIEVKTLSPWDTARFFCMVAVPAYFVGLVAPNRLFVSLFARWNVGEAAVRFLVQLRSKYASDYLRLWFPFGQTLLVMDPPGIDAVLASEDNAADPPLKKRPLSQFIPDALLISSGAEWRARRQFNTSVLQFGEPVHRHAGDFARIIAAEVAQLALTRVDQLGWSDFQALAERISHQVLMGAARTDARMTCQLAAMVKRSNLYVLPRDESIFSAFYDRLHAHLSRSLEMGKSPGSAHCLMADCATPDASATVVHVPSQIGFWFFVLKDALELHVARTLALIVAHADVYARVQSEVDGMQSVDAKAIDGLHYLEGCIVEQLRLWTPVPFLLRRVVDSFAVLDEVPVRAGEQVLIHAGFYHRDARYFGEHAHRFVPTADPGASRPAVYVFSAGRQSCAGQFLARFLLKATLASMLATFRIQLLSPGIDTTKVCYLYDHFGIRLALSPRHAGH